MPTDRISTGTARTPSMGREFLRWYWIEKPKAVLRAYTTYAGVAANVFSIVFLLRTLLQPWKNIRDEYPKGFNLQILAENFALNVTSRAIGFLFRLASIITAIVIQCLLAMGFALYLALWMTYPLLVFPGVVLLLLSLGYA